MKKHFLQFRNSVAAQLQGTRINENEMLLLKQQLIDSIFMASLGIGKNASVMRQFQQLQRYCVQLLDLHKSRSLRESSDQSLVLTEQYLIEILETLQASIYFDVQQKIPLYLEEQLLTVTSEKILLVKAWMQQGQISSKLQGIVLKPYLNIGKKGQLTFHQMNYLLKLIEELAAPELRNQIDEEHLLDHLLRKGFNTPDFNRYYMLFITEKVYAEYQLLGQLEVLYAYERLLNAMTKYPKLRYEPKWEDSRQFLLRFVRTEISYLFRKQELEKPKIPVSLSPTSESYRIKTNLSVDGLAYLLRILVEAEVIEANPRTALMEFIAAHVHTRGKNDGVVSPDSLYTKYRQVTQSTATGMSALLKKMTKQVQQQFNC